MVESRCGLCCSNFNCKEQFDFDCKGCAKEEKPPWGECEVKVCCENREFEHCGECEKFPCNLLKSFSYALEHGDNGARIETCVMWKNKQKRVSIK